MESLNNRIMEAINNRIMEDPFDITYIAIGSANVRNCDNPEDRQQFPPFLEVQYNNNKKIRIINIDPCFEKPYFMKNYLPHLIENKIDILYNENKIDILYNENIEVIYISIIINFDDDNDLLILHNLNQIIMNQNNILIVGDFTGRNTYFLENYFYNLYENTEFQNKFNNLICYNFIIDSDNTCHLNMIKNYPIIENNKIVKFNFINENDFLIKIKNKNLNSIHKKIFTYNFKIFLNVNLYVYRNLVARNITENIMSCINKTIFKDIDINEYSINEINTILINKLLVYDKIIGEIFNKNEYLINIINQINIIDNFKLYNDLILLNYNLEL
jgi:hypothetical protein